MKHPREPARRGVLMGLAHWELMIISVTFVAIYISRETGMLGGVALRVLDDVLVGIALTLALHAARASARTAILHLIAAAVAVTVAVVEAAVTNEDLRWISSAISAYLVIVTAVLVFRIVLGQHYVSADTLLGALAIYLAVGVLFGRTFTAIARANPAAFEPAQRVIDGESSLYYFSFVTLTSLGYGDISPVTATVRILATLEAVIGVMLLAAVVGWVVGLLVAARASTSTDQRLDELAAAIDRLHRTQGNSTPKHAPVVARSATTRTKHSSVASSKTSSQRATPTSASTPPTTPHRCPSSSGTESP